MDMSTKNMVILTIVSLLIVSYSLPLGAEMTLETKPVLSLQIAKVIADACEAKAVEEGWNMNIAIVDDGANLLLFRRMPNAWLGSIDIALDKARTSARMTMPTRMIADITYGEDRTGGPVPGLAHVEGFIAFAGGLPIRAGSTVIGAIGVSGASADQDEACAQAGLDAIAELLE
jgi:glc operon protein GlcG